MALARVGFIPIPPGAKPGFDHADLYGPASRLYVAHTGADRIDVLDCAAGTYLRAIADLPGVAGVLVHAEHDLLVSTDRGCGRVSLFRCSDEALLGRVAVGPHPNGVAYDPSRRRLFVFNLGEPVGVDPTVSVVDLDRRAVAATIPLPGRPRWALYDPASDSVYANIQDPAQIVVLDAGRTAVARTLAVPAAGPHGMAIVGERVYCAADGGALVLLHRDTGEVLGSAGLPGAPDVIWHDDRGNRVLVAVGSPGVVVVVDATLESSQTIQTEPGAHTTAWDPDARRLYVFCPGASGAAVYADS